MGRDLAIDASDLPAYANGQRFVSKGGRERGLDEYSDSDASWGHRSAVSTRKGGGFYGYRVHAAVFARTGLPVAWAVASANAHESTFTAPLIDATKAHGFTPDTVAMDRGYNIERVYAETEERDARPIIPLRETIAVSAATIARPSASTGLGRSRGPIRRAVLPSGVAPRGECRPASRWVAADRLHPLVPRESKRWKSLYRGRASVEREFGRLKHEWALLPLRVRGIERVRLHADLTILAKLACALAREQVEPVAA